MRKGVVLYLAVASLLYNNMFYATDDQQNSPMAAAHIPPRLAILATHLQRTCGQEFQAEQSSGGAVASPMAGDGASDPLSPMGRNDSFMVPGSGAGQIRIGNHNVSHAELSGLGDSISSPRPGITRHHGTRTPLGAHQVGAHQAHGTNTPKGKS